MDVPRAPPPPVTRRGCGICEKVRTVTSPLAFEYAGSPVPAVGWMVVSLEPPGVERCPSTAGPGRALSVRRCVKVYLGNIVVCCRYGSDTGLLLVFTGLLLVYFAVFWTL